MDLASIKSYVTCKKSLSRGVSKIPPSELRMIEEDILKGLAVKQSVYEKDAQVALQMAIEYKSHQDTKTNFTDKDGKESPNSQNQDALDDNPDSEEDIDDFD